MPGEGADVKDCGEVENPHQGGERKVQNNERKGSTSGCSLRARPPLSPLLCSMIFLKASSCLCFESFTDRPVFTSSRKYRQIYYSYARLLKYFGATSFSRPPAPRMYEKVKASVGFGWFKIRLVDFLDA